MSKSSAFLIALAALFFGAIAGGWIVSRFTTQITNSSLAAEAGNAVVTLEMLRAGNPTDAVESLEIKLDGALIGLGSSLSATPKSRRDPSEIKMLQMARDYREKYPRKTGNADVDGSVGRALQLPNEQTQQ